MSDYVEGSLYRLHYDGGEYIGYPTGDGGWYLVDHPQDAWISDHNVNLNKVTGPLRVLGPGERVVEPGQVVLTQGALEWSEVTRALRGIGMALCDDIAEIIDEQTKPPRIPEPGWGTIVKAGVNWRPGRFLFTQHTCNGVIGWQSQDGCTWLAWESLIDPTIVREGVES